MILARQPVGLQRVPSGWWVTYRDGTRERWYGDSGGNIRTAGSTYWASAGGYIGPAGERYYRSGGTDSWIVAGAPVSRILKVSSGAYSVDGARYYRAASDGSSWRAGAETGPYEAPTRTTKIIRMKGSMPSHFKTTPAPREERRR